MKKLFLLICTFLISFAALAQPITAFTPPTSNVDSSSVKYATASIGGGGTLWVQTVVTKVANSGTTLAGYAILQYSTDGTIYQNCPTYKNGTVAVDTFTFANTTAAQGYSWLINNPACPTNHPAYKYRIAYVLTTCKISPPTTYYVRRQ